MKMKFYLILVLSVMMILSACTSAKIPETIPETVSPTPDTGLEINDDAVEPKAPQGITVNKVLYEVLTDNIPEELSKLIEENKVNKGFVARQINNEYYVVVFMGEQSTGGYAIAVTDIEDNEGKTNITVTETKPAEGDMVTQAITYPYQVVKIKSGIAPNFKVFNQDGEEYPEIP